MPDTDSLKTAIGAVIDSILPQVIETRHHLHRNPELSGAEAQTAALVAEKLRGWGAEDIRTGLAGHGVTAILRGPKEGPMLALRADMDALPIQETSGLAYASCRAGVMHACGHDGHTATLLGAAQALSQLKEHLPGPVKFLFQPAEETTGGADAMIAEARLEGVGSIIALHGWPNLEVGQIGYRSGPMMASADRFDLTIRGKGGHAAYSHTTVDPIVVGAQIIAAFQTLASREVSPLDSVVVSVTQFHAGTAYNVIPGVAELKGTVRCLSNEPARLHAGPDGADRGRAVRRLPGRVRFLLRTRPFRKRSYEPVGPPVVENEVPPMFRVTARVEAPWRGRPRPAGAGERPLCILQKTPLHGRRGLRVLCASRSPAPCSGWASGTEVTALHTPTYNFTDGALASITSY